jgi:hypothetical protein
MIRRALTATGIAAAVILGTASPASAAPAVAAKGGGSVANSCAAIADVQIWKQDNSPDGTIKGFRIEYLPCGQGTSNVWRATVKAHPFYVKTPGRAPFCMNAGQFYYPANRGLDQTAVLTPTMSCSNGRAS